MPSFHSPPTRTNTSCLFRRKTRRYLYRSNLRWYPQQSASRAVHYGDRFPGAFGDGARGREGCCCCPSTDVISEDEETLLEQLFKRHNHLKVDKQRHLLSNGRYDASALVGDVKYLGNIYFT